MILVTNARIPSITKSVRIRTIITKTTILLENYGIFRATDSKSFQSCVCKTNLIYDAFQYSFQQ